MCVSIHFVYVWIRFLCVRVCICIVVLFLTCAPPNTPCFLSPRRLSPPLPTFGGVAGILMKIYSKIGQLAESEDGSYKGLHMPMNDGKTESKGFAFIEFVDRKVILERFLSFW